MKRNFTVGQRIGFGFFLLALLVLLPTGWALWFAPSGETAVTATESRLAQFDAVQNLVAQWSSLERGIDRLLLAQDDSLLESELSQNLAAFEQGAAVLPGQLDLENTGEAAEVLTTLQTSAGTLASLAAELLTLAENGRWSEAQTIRLTEIPPAQAQFDTAVARLNNMLFQALTTTNADASQRLSNFRNGWILAAGAALLGGLIIAYLTIRTITPPILQLTDQVHKANQVEMVPLARSDEIGQLSDALVQLVNQQRDDYQALVERVEQRNHALQASNEVSRSLSTILQLDELVLEVVEQVRKTFNYYHVHVYLFDEAQEKLVLVGGTGNAGAAMLAANHALLPDQGLVGRAASYREAVLIPDVHKAANWLPNPLLPETKAEVAVPIAIADRVLGVLDVQHNVANGLTDTDVELLRGIANQVAVAVQNARTYQQIQAQQQHERVASQIGQKIQLAASVDDVLRVAVKELATALNRPKVAIALKNSQQDDQGESTPEPAAEELRTPS